MLTITDSYNCKNSDTVKVVEEPCECSAAHFPNAFTPDQNGFNDYFHVLSGEELILVELMVYNRYGQCVFSTMLVDDFWDGTFKGKPLDTGVFGYAMIAICKYTGEKIIEKGNVTLIR